MKYLLILACLVMCSCEPPRSSKVAEAEPDTRKYTIISYSSTGAEIERFYNTSYVNSAQGWIQFRNNNGKLVTVNGPHTWVEE